MTNEKVKITITDDNRRVFDINKIPVSIDAIIEHLAYVGRWVGAVWLEVIIPVLVSNELNNTLTDTMLELIDHLNTLAPTLVEVIDDDTNARLDTDVVSLRFKVGRVYGALPTTILTEEDMKSLIRKRSKLMNVLWLYSNFYTIIHQADYELRSIEGFHSARIH